jgi:hypothetical protein
LFKILTFGSRRFTAMAVWPMVISKYKRSELGEDVMNHERIHFRQQLEMLFIFFFLWYAAEYFIRLAKYGDKQLAYKNIGFEKEAYFNESDPEYVRNRKPFNWLKLI